MPIRHAPLRRRRSPRRSVRARRFVALALVWLLGGVTLAGPAAADPLGEFQAASGELSRLQDESAVRVDEYNREADVVDRLRAQIDSDTQREAQLNDYLAEDRDRVRRQAVSVYKYGSAPMVGIQAVMAGKDFNEIVRAMRFVAKAQADSARAYSKLREDSTAMQTIGERLKRAEAERSARLGRLAEAKTQIEASIKRQLDIITQYRGQLEAAAMQDSTVAQSVLNSGQAPPPPTPEVAGAIAFAKAQVGKPYVWGATGPDTYDCSGLIMTAYRSVGIYLPRTSGEMHDQLYAQTAPQPGDIAWHPGHVALYLGAGVDVEAPHTGDVVRYKMVANRFVSFHRPWGPRPVSAPSGPDVMDSGGGSAPASPASSSATTSKPASGSTTRPTAATTAPPG